MAQDFFVNFSEPSFPTASVAGGSHDCQMPISFLRDIPIGNRKSASAMDRTHPLPRGGTDFIASEPPDVSQSRGCKLEDLGWLVTKPLRILGSAVKD